MNTLLVVPAHNEKLFLQSTIEKIRTHVHTSTFEDKHIDILVVENGSTDGTRKVAKSIAEKYSDVRVIQVDAPGKGHALYSGWLEGDYDCYCYVDADLAHGVSSITTMISLIQNGADIVVGSRTLPRSQVQRHWVRKFLTINYNLLLKIVFQVNFTDAQAGCKGISRKVRDTIASGITEKGYFYDTLLLIRAERSGYRIHDFPVIYNDPRRGRFSLVQTIGYFLYKVFVLRIRLWNNK